MELKRIESTWYADGMEAVLRLGMSGAEPDHSYLVDITRPCCERFVLQPQRPSEDGSLTCILPRESFERSETVLVRVRSARSEDPATVVWEGHVLAREVEGEPQVEFVGSEELPAATAA
jgi:hypothetical protein